MTLARTDVDVLDAIYGQIAELGDAFTDATPAERATIMERLDDLFDQVTEIKRARSLENLVHGRSRTR